MLASNASRKQLLFAMTGACGVPGGIATANLNILHALVELAKEKNNDFTVFSLLEKPLDRPSFLPPWVRFLAFQGNKFLFSMSLLRATIKKPVFCMDHVRLSSPLLPFSAARVVRTIIFAHGSESWKRLRRINRLSYRCASLCLTNSFFTLKKMQERISNINTKACQLGLSPNFTLNYTAPVPVPHDPIELEAVDGRKQKLGIRFFLLVARMLSPHKNSEEGQKGHRPLIEILPELQKDFPDVQLVFPGPGNDQQNLCELARQKGVASSVFFPGPIPHELLVSLYRQCYAYVMPSKQEGFGLAYLEAMNYAKPCVGCFDQGAEDIIVHGETGFLVRDPNDPKELVGILRNLLNNPDLAQQLGMNGFERLHKHFTSKHHQERVKEQISKVL